MSRARAGLPLLAALLFLAGCVAEQGAAPAPARPDPEPAGCTVGRVIDGDTVDLACPDTGRERTRLVGFDAPEVFSPGCPEELALGRQATAQLRTMVRQGQRFDVRRQGHDRYGRRLARLSIDGEDVARVMISAGLAVRYSGGRRISWCQRLSA